MSNLKIAYADIPYNAINLTASAALWGVSQAYDVIAGERSHETELASAATSMNYTFDLGSGYTSMQASADYFIVARADLADIQGAADVKLQRSSDGIAWTDVCDSSATGSLYGPDSADYYASFASVGPYRYWRAEFSSAGAVKFRISKIYFGAIFDIGVNPYYDVQRIVPSAGTWYATSGAAYSMRNADPFYRIKLRWEGVTDAKLVNFENYVVINAREAPVFLVAPTETKILDGENVIHARLTETSAVKVMHNYNVVEATFEEMAI